MKKIEKIILYFIFASMLYSCGASDAGKILRNEKVTNTDEFLVKKRDPLTLPPDYNTIPKPDSLNKTKTKEKNIKKILKISEEEMSKKNTSTVEQSILNQIGQ
tara:strand:+ start:209 stop:517 length:309 start_codon:yes stop_codon:yes gene_type:complete